MLNKSSPILTRGEKHNTRLNRFVSSILYKPVTTQLKGCFPCAACSVAQAKEETPVKPTEQGRCSCRNFSQSKIYGEESRTAPDYSCAALLCNAKMPKMSVEVKMFFQPKAPFWGLCFSFVLNPVCLQDSIHTCWGGFLPSLSECDNESKVPSLLLSKVIMENCSLASGCEMLSQCSQKIITQN